MMKPGNGFAPFSLRHVVEASLTGVKTMILVVFW